MFRKSIILSFYTPHNGFIRCIALCILEIVIDPDTHTFFLSLLHKGTGQLEENKLLSEKNLCARVPRFITSRVAQKYLIRVTTPSADFLG